jgi:glutamyl-tRNA reductase
MRDVDVVIAATSSAETLLTRDDVDNLMKARRNRPLLLIDLAVPRNNDRWAGSSMSLYRIKKIWKGWLAAAFRLASESWRRVIKLSRHTSRR